MARMWFTDDPVDVVDGYVTHHPVKVLQARRKGHQSATFRRQVPISVTVHEDQPLDKNLSMLL